MTTNNVEIWGCITPGDPMKRVVVVDSPLDLILIFTALKESGRYFCLEWRTADPNDPGGRWQRKPAA